MREMRLADVQVGRWTVKRLREYVSEILSWEFSLQSHSVCWVAQKKNWFKLNTCFLSWFSFPWDVGRINTTDDYLVCVRIGKLTKFLAEIMSFDKSFFQQFKCLTLIPSGESLLYSWDEFHDLQFSTSMNHFLSKIFNFTCEKNYIENLISSTVTVRWSRKKKLQKELVHTFQLSQWIMSPREWVATYHCETVSNAIPYVTSTSSQLLHNLYWHSRLQMEVVTRDSRLMPIRTHRYVLSEIYRWDI